MRFQPKPLVFSGDVKLRQAGPASGGVDNGASAVGFFRRDDVEEIVAPHLADRNVLQSIDSMVARRVKQRGIEIEARNALCGRRDWQNKGFVVQKNSRREDFRRGRKPVVLWQAILSLIVREPLIL